MRQHRPHQRGRGGLAALLLALTPLAAAPAAAAPAATAPAAAKTVVAKGHVDVVDVRLRSGALKLSTTADLPGKPNTELEPADTIIQLADVPAARATAPGGALDFLGPAGTPLWIAPQAQEPTIIFPGTTTERIPRGALAGNKVTVNLVSVRAPEGGRFEMFSTDSVGRPTRRWSSTDQAVRTITMNVGGHSHANWAFTKLGAYQLEVEATARTAAGKDVSARATYTWQVGPLPPRDVAVGLAGWQPRFAPGRSYQLTAQPSPGFTGTVRWYERQPGAAGFVHRRSEDGLTYAFTAHPPTAGGPGHSGTQVYAEAVHPDGSPAGRSRTVEIVVDHPDLPGTVLTVVGVDPPPGRSAALTAVQTPRTALDRYRWYVRVPGARDFSADPDATTGRFAVPAGSAPDGTQVVARLFDHQQRVVASSAPATLRTGGGRAWFAPAAAAVGTAPAALARPGSPALVADGHFDLGPTLRKGRLAVVVRDDRTQPATIRQPGDLVFHLDRPAEVEVPPGAGLDFIAKPGAKVWVVGQTQQAGVPWLGLNTQDAGLTRDVTGPVTMHLDKVEGPGRFAAYLGGQFGGVGKRIFDNVGGPTSYEMPLNVHQHGNWVFTAAGRYRLTVTTRATGRDGAKLSDTCVLTFVAGPKPADTGGGTGGGSNGGGSGTGGGGTGGGSGGSGLPHTGTDLADLAVAGLSLVALGAAAVRLARRSGPPARPVPAAG
ncbi:hypothetical protein GCM10010124_38740 [Pilimelia terevasa]|uniref:ABC transporter-associated repeat protein n=1 Tax=Pilimelia terevasa TaxID=53372 RepID=A0A8J3BRY4_9ACTN|nr:TIGR03773 family transporter-associated surface protein [Pilimelia terevasa]GGK42181.1 hypothetical protein GCM10010124_38740 [Pilimelia terevasa]